MNSPTILPELGRRVRAIAAPLLLGFTIATPLVGQRPPRPADVEGLDPTAAERLEARIADLVEQGEVPGLSAALVLDGTIAWTGAFGVRDASTGEPVTEQTVFQAASLTKQVFAYAVLRLADRGVIDLDAPLGGYLPNPRIDHDERHEGVTARRVLSHSTGLPNWGGERLEFGFDPGESFRYSGEGYVYLARVLEERTGLALDDLLRREVFAPLGMTSSAVVWRDEFEGRAAARHDDWGEAFGVDRPAEANAAASLLTTAEDYARFLVALLEGRGLRAGTLAGALEPRVQVATSDREPVEGLYWGLGWGLELDDGDRAMWQWGHNDGFRAYLLAHPDRRDAFVYFTNGGTGLSIVRDLLGAVSEDAGLPGGPHPALDWLGYEQHDEPRRRARRSLARAFMEGGERGGMEGLEALRAESPELADAELLATVGLILTGRGLTEEGVALLERTVGFHPESSGARATLGQALMNAGRYERALGEYRRARKALSEDPDEPDDDRSEIERAIGWLEEAVEARARPPSVAPGTLERYVGDYGPRHIRLEGGTLRYRRDGNRAYELFPLTETTFLLDDLGSFRIRFESDESGEITGITGLYVDGQTDWTPRDP